MHTELIYYHTLEVRLVRYSTYTALTLFKHYKYVQNAVHSLVIRWHTLLLIAHTLRVS